jgi:phosphoribosylformylglycinamidine cyclo-ligase
MELYVSPDKLNSIIDICNSFNLEARQVGRVEASDKKQLTIVSEKGEFIY